MDFGNLPTRLLSAVKNLGDSAKETAQLIRTSNNFQPRCVYDIEILSSKAKAFMEEELKPSTEEQRI